MSVKLMRWAAGVDFVVELGAAINLSSEGDDGGGVAALNVNGGLMSGAVTPSGTGAFSNRAIIVPDPGGTTAFEVRMTVNSGGFTTGTTGTWIDLTELRLWITVGAASVNATLEIRRASDGTVLDSVSVLMNGS